MPFVSFEQLRLLTKSLDIKVQESGLNQIQSQCKSFTGFYTDISN